MTNGQDGGDPKGREVDGRQQGSGHGGVERRSLSISYVDLSGGGGVRSRTWVQGFGLARPANDDAISHFSLCRQQLGVL